MFSIAFDKPSAVYIPGEEVTGAVTLQLNKSFQAGAVRLYLNGRVWTYWTRNYCDANGPYTYRFEDTVNFLRIGNNVATEGAELLNVGEHTLQFNFRLPKDSPPSFNDKDGKVFYNLTVEFERRLGYKSVKKNLTVLPFLDLNQVPLAATPITLEKTKKIGLLTNGSITVNMRIPKTGFVPGEVVPLHCTLNNDTSNRRVKAKVQLWQRIRYKTSTGMKITTKTVLAEEKRKFSLSPRSRSEILLDVTVPPTIPSVNKDNVAVDFYVLIKFRTTSILSTKIKLRTWLLIGTVAVDEPVAHEESVDVNEFAFDNLNFNSDTPLIDFSA